MEYIIGDWTATGVFAMATGRIYLT